MEVRTTRGTGRLDLARGRGTSWLVLGHGAGGASWTPDVLAAREAALSLGWSVALVEQPWRVAGRRVAPAPAQLDEAWDQLLDALVARVAPARWVLGGRSAGARVACRGAAARRAAGVLALSFPLHPPRRPERSRAAELVAAVAPADPAADADDADDADDGAGGRPGRGRPVLVVQGERDAMGLPQEVRAAAPPGVGVVAVPGTHQLGRAGRGGPAGTPGPVGAAVQDWLAGLR